RPYNCISARRKTPQTIYEWTWERSIRGPLNRIHSERLRPMIDSRYRPEVAQPASSQPPAEAVRLQPAFFLRTKLAPPRPAPALLPRPRLMKRLEANLSRTVTLVTANAGAGKTTLVADFVREYAPRFVWYQLDHTD